MTHAQSTPPPTSFRRLGRYLAVLALVAAPTWAARAGEAPPPAPPAGPGSQETLGQEVVEDPSTAVATQDPFGTFLKSLERQLDRLAVQPQRTATKTALHDIWSATLRPRLSKMRFDLSVVAAPQRWILDSTTGRRLGIRTDAWNDIVPRMASLHTTLGGALDGTMKSQVRFTSPYGLGAPGTPQPPGAILPPYALSLFQYEGTLFRRYRVAPFVHGHELHDYHRFLGHLENIWLRRAHDWEQYRRRLATSEAISRAAQLHEAAIGERVEELRMLMLSVRTLLSALQAAEEDRLHAGLERAAHFPAQIQSIQESLLRMRLGRLDALEKGQDGSATYGSILRRDWLAPRNTVLRLLDAVTDAGFASR